MKTKILNKVISILGIIGFLFFSSSCVPTGDMGGKTVKVPEKNTQTVAGIPTDDAPETQLSIQVMTAPSPLSFSPDGKLLLTYSGTSTTHTMQIWDVASRKLLRTFVPAVEYAMHAKVRWEPKGKHLIVADMSTYVQVVDIHTGKTVAMIDSEHQGDGVSLVDFTSNGNVILKRLNGKVLIYDLKAQKVVKKYSLAYSKYAVTPDKKYIIRQSRSSNYMFDWLDIYTGRTVSKFTIPGAHLLTFDFSLSPDGNYIIRKPLIINKSTGDTLKNLEIINIRQKSMVKVKLKTFLPDTKSIQVSHDSQYFFNKGTHFVRDNTIVFPLQMYSMSTGQLMKTIEANAQNFVYPVSSGSPLVAMEMTGPDNHLYGQNLDSLTPGTLESYYHKSIALYDFENDRYLDPIVGLFDVPYRQNPIDILAGNRLSYNGITFNLNDGLIAETGATESICAGVSLTSSTVLKPTLTSPDGQYLAIRGGIMDFNGSKLFEADGAVQSVNLKHSTEPLSVGKHLFTVGEKYTSTAVAFSQDSKFIAVGNFDNQMKGNIFFSSYFRWEKTNGVEIWDIESKTMIRRLNGLSGKVNDLKFSPDGSKIFVGLNDSWIQQYDIPTGNLVASYKTGAAIKNILISNDGKRMISESFGVSYWDLTTSKQLLNFVTLKSFLPAQPDEYLVWTPEGYYHGSDMIARTFVHLVNKAKTYSIDQFFEQFYSKAMVKRKAGGLEPTALEEMELPKINITEKIEQSPPPSVAIVSPAMGKQLDQKEITVEVRITDNGGGIDEIKLLHNGKRISEGTRAISLVKKNRDHTVTRTYSAILVNGKNTFTATAYSRERIESRAAQIDVLFEGSAKTASSYIVAIGINTYKNSRLNLNYARPDAEAFTDLVSRKSSKLFSNVHPVSLYDQEATRSNILQALDEVARQAGPEDVFTFYYAGHGSVVDDTFYFVPTENVRLYESERLNKDALTSKDIQEKFARIKALKQLVVVDACQSGAATEMLALRGAAEEKAMAQLARSSGVHVLASAGSEQYAAEFSALGHGVFTYALLKGLQGGADGSPRDGKVTIYELKSYIDDQVPELTEKHKGEAQYPNTFSKGQDFPLIVQ